MPCRHTGRTGTTYNSHSIEKQNERKKGKNENNIYIRQSKREKRNIKMEETDCRAPLQGMRRCGRHYLTRTSWKKTKRKKHRYLIILVNRKISRTNQREKNRQIKAQSTLQVAAAVRVRVRVVYPQVLPASPPGTLLPCRSSPSCVRHISPAPRRQPIRNKHNRLVIHPRYTAHSMRLINNRRKEDK